MHFTFDSLIALSLDFPITLPYGQYFYFSAFRMILYDMMSLHANARDFISQNNNFSTYISMFLSYLFNM